MKNHFITPYFGNKREEVIKIYSMIDMDKYDTIVEPFCGSSAISYYIWTKNKDRNIKYILNDNNKNLIELYKICMDEEKTIQFQNEVNELKARTDSKEKYLEVKKKSENDPLSYFYINKIYNIRPGLYSDKKQSVDILNHPIIDFLRNADIEILNTDGVEVYNEYKSDPKSLIFLDPPYMMTDNAWYKNPSMLIYDFLNNNDIDKEKAKILICVNNTWIMNLLFKGKKTLIYDKIYQTTKNNIKHIIYENNI